MSTYIIVKYIILLYSIFIDILWRCIYMVKIALEEFLDIRRRSVYWLSRQTGISQNNLANLIKNETKSIKFENLEKICLALNCTPNDIIKIINKDEEKAAE